MGEFFSDKLYLIFGFVNPITLLFLNLSDIGGNFFITYSFKNTSSFKFLELVISVEFVHKEKRQKNNFAISSDFAKCFDEFRISSVDNKLLATRHNAQI